MCLLNIFATILKEDMVWNRISPKTVLFLSFCKSLCDFVKKSAISMTNANKSYYVILEFYDYSTISVTNAFPAFDLLSIALSHLWCKSPASAPALGALFKPDSLLVILVEMWMNLESLAMFKPLFGSSEKTEGYRRESVRILGSCQGRCGRFYYHSVFLISFDRPKMTFDCDCTLAQQLNL